MKALGINGSPIKGGNVDILVKEVLKGIKQKAGKSNIVDEIFYLDELKIMPCKSCGKAPPEPALCLYHDDMDLLYPQVLSGNFFVLGSPIYFDSVSAQMKLFIDRCNCFRPISKSPEGTYFFKRQAKSLPLPRKGIIILVGGVWQRFDLALSVVKGFLKWADIEYLDKLIFSHEDWKKGAVKRETEVLRKALEIGRKVAG